MSSLFYTPTKHPFPEKEIPQVLTGDRPELTEFYQLAWRLAWNHVYETTCLPHSPFIGEGCNTNRIWIWDSCLMTMFCRYAPDLFPVENTLDNLYQVLAWENKCPMVIHHPDNPPLFAWAELQLFQHTGDLTRLNKILPTLIHHFDFLEKSDFSGFQHHYPFPDWKRCSEGYLWSGNPSGMDNSPRGRGDYTSIYWVDALAQQALSASCIAEIASLLKESNTVSRFQKEYEVKKTLLQNYWDDQTGAFLDKYVTGGFCRVLTPASYWALLAKCGSPSQAERQFSLLKNPQKLGGMIPFPSVSRDDSDFVPVGAYWSGGVWLPVAYMGIKAAEKYGDLKLASELTDHLVSSMYRTWKEFSPHTIWECYSPTEYKGSTNKVNALCRTDFCGWSALGPISLLIENLIGIHSISAVEKRILWHPALTGKIGIKNLLLGKDRVSLMLENNTLMVETSTPLTVVLNGKEILCTTGNNNYSI